MNATILITGGAGYIGSHTAVELLNAGLRVIILDNLSNAEPFILQRIEAITGQRPLFYQEDLRHREAVDKIFRENKIDAVIHFAALKSVSESLRFPLKYFDNNINALVILLEVMEAHKVRDIVFSSSATVYGSPDVLPVTEEAPMKKALSAYGKTKQMGEEILEEVTNATDLRVIALRYFNPVGAHDSALLGELPRGVPSNLMPFIMQTAIGKREQLVVYGDDYDTPDGTCIRDYIHVVDLAAAHLRACERLLSGGQGKAFERFNLGTGRGVSVLEMIRMTEAVTGQPLNVRIGPRREGDVPEIFASSALAHAVLNWSAGRDLRNMVETAWNWEKRLRDHGDL